MTSWVQGTDQWLRGVVPVTGSRQGKPAAERIYTVTEVARMFKVSRHTVFKWLMTDEDGNAVIPPSAWFKLPGGQIRIKQEAVDILMEDG